MGSSGSKYDMTGNAGDEIPTDVKASGSVKRRKEKASTNEVESPLVKKSETGENYHPSSEEHTIATTDESPAEPTSNGSTQHVIQEELSQNDESGSSVITAEEVQNKSENDSDIEIAATETERNDEQHSSNGDNDADNNLE